MALRLSCKDGGSIMIGDDIVITVEAGSRVTLAVEAPRGLRVIRSRPCVVCGGWTFGLAPDSNKGLCDRPRCRGEAT